MGDKKDENDNVSGVPKFVQETWAKKRREAARRKKAAKLRKKRGEK